MTQPQQYSKIHERPKYRTILHCDLNNFFASAELLDHPELRDRPVIVCGAVEDRHGIVLAKNYPAKACGIITGEAIWQAKGKCPDIVELSPHYDKYMELSRAVRAIYSRYTNQIEPFGMDECFLDVTGSRYIFGDGETIANDIRETVKRETGLTISVGVSFNKIFAKLGSDMKKPDAVTVIPPERFREIVWPCPARDMLGVGMKTYQKLWYRSIRTIGDIANCRRELMRSYLGKLGDVLWIYANGLESSPVTDENYVEPVKSIGHGTTTVADLENEREVFNVIISLTEEIGTKLRKNELKCGGVVVGIRESDLTYREYQEKLPHPTQLSREISRRAMSLFHRKHVWRENIRSVTVRAIYISSDSAPEQLDLFYSDSKETALLSLERTLDSLRSRYGGGIITEAVRKTDIKAPRDRIGHPDYHFFN